MTVNFIQKRVYFYVLSLILIVASIVAVSVWGLRLGIDFKGGTLMEVQFASELAPTADLVREKLTPLNLRSLSVQPTENFGMILRYLSSDETANDQVLTTLKEFDKDLNQRRVDFIGASVSSQIKSQAFTGTLFALLGIALYIAWAFRRVSQPISSWEYGLGAIVALGHDILITVGVFSVLGHYFGIEVGVPFIAALLTILGYSVNDTIVVYDRVRENLLRSRSHMSFETIVNHSLNETIVRSLNTSLTVIIVLIAIALLGGESVRWFAVALLVGVGFGTYSSIFIASALLVTRYRMKMKK
ncbi:MAG: protein translocase subunit SecF [Candidatus Moraniibacteriota bacterium]|nr:MAG: protein translocase subunit SecF [Candidatus Moranbacteria bacterium]